MSRRNIAQKRYPKRDKVYNSCLVTLLTQRVLKNGKKRLAENIVQGAFSIIAEKTGNDPLQTFEHAVNNVRPVVQLKSRRVGGSTYQVPVNVSLYRSINLALKWIITAAKGRSGRAFTYKLAQELLDAANSTGNAYRKREETHRMAKANKAFAYLRF